MNVAAAKIWPRRARHIVLTSGQAKIGQAKIVPHLR
jgi:hypothetical protein